MLSNLTIKALNAETGEFKEKVLALTTETKPDCLIGRHPNCDLVLESEEVSRIHGRIWYQDGQCFYTDLGSTDGSQIDNREVETNRVERLLPNSLLRIGGFVVTISEVSERQKTLEKSLLTEKHWNSGELTVRCIDAIAETHDVKTFRLVADPPVQFSYKPGQFVTLDLEIEDKRVMRSYSISSTPSRPHILEITVKRVPAPPDEPDAPPGLVSNWLHDRLGVGSEVKLKAPMGKFTCVDRPASKLLFISAGSGITPMMSMSRWLCDVGADVDIVFVYSTRSLRDLIFRHELESMAARYSNFKLAVTTTRSEPGQAWQGYTGRINEFMLKAIAPDFLDRTVYLCGSNPFMKGVKTILETLRFPMENYYEESFGSPKHKSLADDKLQDSVTEAKIVSLDSRRKEKDSSHQSENEQSPLVIFAKSDKAIACDSEDTVLEIAEQEGLALSSGCRMGACGVCKLPLLEGEVNYDCDFKCEPGYLLPCIAKPVGRVAIEA